MLEKLIRLANRLDEKGLYEEANIIDKAIKLYAEEDEVEQEPLEELEEPEAPGPELVSPAEKVRAAFENTPVDYLASNLAMRNPGADAEGSIFAEPQSKESLQNAAWEPFKHPSIQSPAEGFIAPIPGKMGIVPLADVPGDTPVTLTDPKGTGKLSAVLQGLPRADVDYTIALVGPHGDNEVIYTFFPGDPIAPSMLDADSVSTDNRNITAADAVNLGFEYAKIGGE